VEEGALGMREQQVIPSRMLQGIYELHVNAREAANAHRILTRINTDF
jgi:hypothetical protein